MSSRESLILCEGYHDRAFWAGWLLRLGCVDPGLDSTRGGRQKVVDPWGKAVTGGDFGYRTKRDGFVRVRPCGGKDRLFDRARSRLDQERQRAQQDKTQIQLARLVLTVDPDAPADGASSKTGFRQQDLGSWVCPFDEKARQDGSGDWLLFDGEVVVSLVRWTANDASGEGLPEQQTLERLVCAALVAAFPKRGPSVQNWLDSRPDAPDAGPKEFAWSHMAGWYAEHGCQEFYSYLWTAERGDGRVRAELEKRLRDCGAWRIAEALAE